MNVIIVEDEIPAAEKLERYLQKYDPSIRVLAILHSVKDTVEWLRENRANLDLIFIDIQLRDGLSFQVFQQVTVDTPVIFTTAYNEFALDAFKVNSIDYLLKPITFTDLTSSLKKFSVLKEQLKGKGDDLTRMQETFSSLKTRTYKTRFMVKVGEHIKSIPIEQVSFFYADGREVYLVAMQGRKFIIDYTLESLEHILDPALFFRLNRTFIVNINAIRDVLVYSNSRLKIIPIQDFDREMIVSREKVNEFKEWFDGVRKS
ncbi:MAG: LytTR family DNA-binding domain-containing protein [Cyclobacteriaceae bacterium]